MVQSQDFNTLISAPREQLQSDLIIPGGMVSFRLWFSSACESKPGRSVKLAFCAHLDRLQNCESESSRAASAGLSAGRLSEPEPAAERHYRKQNSKCSELQNSCQAISCAHLSPRLSCFYKMKYFPVHLSWSCFENFKLSLHVFMTDRRILY